MEVTSGKSFPGLPGEMYGSSYLKRYSFAKTTISEDDYECAFPKRFRIRVSYYPVLN